METAVCSCSSVLGQTFHSSQKPYPSIIISSWQVACFVGNGSIVEWSVSLWPINNCQAAGVYIISSWDRENGLESKGGGHSWRQWQNKLAIQMRSYHYHHKLLAEQLEMRLEGAVVKATATGSNSMWCSADEGSWMLQDYLLVQWGVVGWGMVFGAFGAEGLWFNSFSSCHIGMLGKSFTRNCLYDVMWCPVAALRLNYLHSSLNLRWFYLVVLGLGAPLSSPLEEVLYKCL